MRKIVGTTSLIIKCCKLYYEDSLTQDEISKNLGISRPTVSRLLDEGRKQGIVKIEILNPLKNNYEDLERDIEKKYNIRETIIVDDNDDENIQKKVAAKAAAQYLQRIVKKDNKIGVSMGTTIKNISKYITQNQRLQLQFIPLVGGIGQIQIDIHPNQIVMDLARAYNGEFKLLHVPAVVSNADIRDNFIKEKSINEILMIGKSVDIAVVGIGSPVIKRSTMMKSGYFDIEDIRKFKKEGAVGDICLQFYNINGEFKNFQFNKRVVGITLEDIRNIKTVIGVACGNDKVQAIKGALKGNFLDVLITDYSTAKIIYENTI
ncbi:MAG: sugar-binding transcriptional regulator [Clostridium sp.]|uniref:sugar-binding transcriptional regulator n=1 Tax=Clostridium sp. TaxID=1506 RepID=UPI0025C41B94|nr:sugar-binding transcriptional regulator [Clostridium sp.]MCH3965777.1 sugar-binding transcriptional regulator [Clostridium sp.]MCI1717186.1 sugar-binding transcriptional regulator [Clostridium sp.]MCI1801526.1 sugar-binding transcriptional regulator [Clostridium sp.]MCI1815343.1 sugar-binding transcriptional regulator [Clostridium sp.]MCI1872246.1 sugar-binding transcriptional regulator [Clostridium sp.]